MRRADPGAGQHRDRQLRDHRHVDRDAVAGPDPELLERVGGLADLALEVGVGQRPGVAGLADPVVGDLVAEARARRGGRRSCRRRSARRRRTTSRTAGPTRASCRTASTSRCRSRASFAQKASKSRSASSYRLGVRVGLGSEGGVRREGPTLGHEVLDLGQVRGLGLDAHGSPPAFGAWRPFYARRPCAARRQPSTRVSRRPATQVASCSDSAQAARARPVRHRPARGRPAAAAGSRCRSRGTRRGAACRKLAAGGPLVRGPDGAQDLERHAVFAEGLDPLDARRLEDPALPDRIVGISLPDRVDDGDRRVDVRAVGDRDVLVDPGPDAGPVGGDLDLAVRDGVDDAVDVPERRPPEAEVLDRPATPRRCDDVAHANWFSTRISAPVK